MSMKLKQKKKWFKIRNEITRSRAFFLFITRNIKYEIHSDFHLTFHRFTSLPYAKWMKTDYMTIKSKVIQTKKNKTFVFHLSFTWCMMMDHNAIWRVKFQYFDSHMRKVPKMAQPNFYIHFSYRYGIFICEIWMWK